MVKFEPREKGNRHDTGRRLTRLERFGILRRAKGIPSLDNLDKPLVRLNKALVCPRLYCRRAKKGDNDLAQPSGSTFGSL
jgi:hypothetical protein